MREITVSREIDAPQSALTGEVAPGAGLEPATF
jgi:hypothetical protein